MMKSVNDVPDDNCDQGVENVETTIVKTEKLSKDSIFDDRGRKARRNSNGVDLVPDAYDGEKRIAVLRISKSGRRVPIDVSRLQKEEVEKLKPRRK